MNFFWNLRKKLEGCIPYRLLTHKAKIRRIIFAEIHNEETNKCVPKINESRQLNNLIYNKNEKSENRVSGEVY